MTPASARPGAPTTPLSDRGVGPAVSSRVDAHRPTPATAWWLRLIAAGCVALVAAWCWGWAAHGHPVVAWVGAGLLLAAHAPILLLDIALMHRINRHDPAPRARPVELVRAWWNETRLGFEVFGWRQPWRWAAEPDHLPARSQGRRGVVLVHGFMCNRGLWNRWMPRLRARDVPHMAIDLGPAFGDIGGCSARIDDAVRRMHEATGMAPVIVAHSMGGLAVRAWMRDAAGISPREQTEVHRVVTIGSPHHGTATGHRGPMSNVAQMRPGSPWLTELARGETPTCRQRFVCFYSHCDEIVFPASTATLEGADNRHVRAMGHMQLIEHPDVFDTVLAAATTGTPKEKAAHEARPEIP